MNEEDEYEVNKNKVKDDNGLKLLMKGIGELRDQAVHIPKSIGPILMKMCLTDKTLTDDERVAFAKGVAYTTLLFNGTNTAIGSEKNIKYYAKLVDTKFIHGITFCHMHWNGLLNLIFVNGECKMSLTKKGVDVAKQSENSQR